MEWDAATRKGSSEGPTAVIQLCSMSQIAVLHLSAMGKVPLELRRILGDPDIIKCGVAIAMDCKKLHRD